MEKDTHNAEDREKYNNIRKCYTNPYRLKKASILIISLYIISVSFNILATANANCYDLSEENSIKISAPKEPKDREIVDSILFDYSEKPLTVTEGVEYLTKLLEESTLPKEKLGELSELLGNRPTALTLAAGTLSNKKITLEDYIDRVNETKQLQNSGLNDYEKKIAKAMSISIYFLKNEEGDVGRLANRILQVFGYLEKGHSVILDFLEAVTNKSSMEVDEATDLLRNYSLFFKQREEPRKYSIVFIIISRLLQPVIRFLGKNEENETLEMILSTEGFWDYKASPFNYSNDLLKIKYPKIRAQLIDQPKLGDLIENKKYSQAIELSSNIHHVIKTPESLYNQAKCLELSGNITEAIKMLVCLHAQVTWTFADQESLLNHFDGSGIVNTIYGRVGKPIIDGYLIHLFLQEKNEGKAAEVLKSGREFLIPYTNKFLLQLIQLINGFSIENYKLKWELHEKFIIFEVGTDDAGNKIDLNFLPSLPKTIQFPTNLKNLRLTRPLFVDNDGKELTEFDVSHLIGRNLKTFHLSGYQVDNKLRISFQKLASVQDIVLGHEIQILLEENTRISPKSLAIEDSIFIVNGSDADQVFLNDLVDFSEIQELKLLKYTGSPNIKIDMSNSSVSVRNLELTNVEVVDWGKAAWKAERLHLRDLNFSTSNSMEIRQLDAKWSTINLSALPNSIKKMVLHNDIKLERNGAVNLPNLNHLTWNIRELGPSALNFFSNCSHLKDLDFVSNVARLRSTDIPKSVKRIKASNVEIIEEKELEIETLVLEWHYITWQISSKLKVNHLIFFINGIISDDKMNEIFGLLERCTILTIGKFTWNENKFEDSELAKLVDKKGEYYTFEKKRGRAITEDAFQILFNF